MSPSSDASLRICLLSPWYGGSHRRWADEWKKASIHHIDIFSLEAAHWKWRMHGAAVTLATKLIDSEADYDLIVADDMMDVAVFSAMVRAHGVSSPIVTYFHENQIHYPKSPDDTDIKQGRDLHYGFINYTTALVSDRVYFNSNYNRNSFLNSLPGFLSSFPDHQNRTTIDQIKAKTAVLHLGMDLSAFDKFQPNPDTIRKDKPIILWNHRREYDKNPESFFKALFALKDRGEEFEVFLLGEGSTREPPIFKHARSELADYIVKDQSIDGFMEYADCLWRADIIPVTSNQDYFGGSLIEAVACGCHPLLPRRLAYPEHFPEADVYYDNDDELVDRLYEIIRSELWRESSPLSELARRYDWSHQVESYDKMMAEAAEI